MTLAQSSGNDTAMSVRQKIAGHPWVRPLLSSPLLLNGYSLIASAGLTSILGVVFWMLATRLFTPEQVGFGAALISSMTTIGYFAQMNLGSVLNRFLPTSGTGKSKLILKTYLSAGSLAAVSALLFALGIGYFAPPLEVLGDHWGAIAWFVAATVIWTVFALQDAALAGLRKAVIVPIENALYASAKILLLVVLAFMVLPVPGGIFFAWTIPLVPAIAIVSAIIFRNAYATKAEDTAPGFKTVFRFVGWDYAGSLAMAAAFGLAPLVVLTVSGEAANAVYHIAWTFTYSIYLIGRSMSISLVTEGAANRPRLRKLVADTVSHTLPLVIGAVLFVVATAPLLMGLFGPVYEQNGTGILRVLVLSCIPWAATTIFIAAARVNGQTHLVALVQLVTLIVFSLSAALLAPDLGAMGISIAWLSAHILTFAGILAGHLFTKGFLSACEWALTIVSSAGQTVSSAMQTLRPGDRKTGAADGLATERSAHESLEGLVPHLLSGSLSDVSVVLFKEPNADQPLEDRPAKLVLKSTRTDQGAASLKRNVHVLERLQSDERLGDIRKLVPRFLEMESLVQETSSLETAVQGRDGRRVLFDKSHEADALEAAIQTASELHSRTSFPAVIDERWTGNWLQSPTLALKSLPHALLSTGRRDLEIDHLFRRLRETLTGRQVSLGRCHGDFSPGNILFTEDTRAQGRLSVSGLIDWDNSREDAPVEFDLFHLLLAMKTQTTGEELGIVVRSVLADGWSRQERDLIDRGREKPAENSGEDQTIDRSMLLLTWLNHLAANVNKSQRYAQSRFWIAANLDMVLLALKQDSFQAT